MRKALSLIFVLVLLVSAACVPAAAEEASVPSYSVDAAEQFCNAWNDYYSRNGIYMTGGYSLEDDNSTIKRFWMIYNGENVEMNYGSGLIPARSDLFLSYEMSDQSYTFSVFCDGLKSDLQKMTVYADDRVISDIYVVSDHDQVDYWMMSLSTSDTLDLYDLDSFTARLVIDGKSHVLDISYEDYDYYYDIVYWLVRAQLYTCTTYDTYLDPKYLPEESAAATLTPAPNAKAAYSFREDLDGIDDAAQSVFYIEVLDSGFESVGRASGFVAFDEHLLVTNQHVIEDAAYLQVEGEDGSVYVLDKVVMSDKTRDIAILLFPEGKKYRSLEMDAEMELKRGQPVVTIGNPIGYRGTVAYGNISAFPYLADYGNLRCIQFTAPTSQGSSGGCLFNDSGKVIGVTSGVGISEYSGEVGNDVGLAVPVAVVQELYRLWDGQNYETLGTARALDLINVPAATPTPEPSPTPAPDLSRSLELQDMYWEKIEDDRVILTFDVTNSGPAVKSFELYLYVTGAGGSRLYGDSYVFNRTSAVPAATGETVRSDRFVVPQWSNISTVYCGVRKIVFDSGETVTVSDVNYDIYEVR